jgi:hypothetical protein
VEQATDPRWVLALRTSERLQGTILPPEDREQLLSLGRTLGLTPFDSNLVIAIVQDQARRGQPAEHCPQAGVAQLAMVPRPRRSSLLHSLIQGRWKTIAWLIAGLVGLEVAAFVWFV